MKRIDHSLRCVPNKHESDETAAGQPKSALMYTFALRCLAGSLDDPPVNNCRRQSDVMMKTKTSGKHLSERKQSAGATVQ